MPVASDKRRPVHGLWKTNASRNGEKPLIRSFGSTVYVSPLWLDICLPAADVLRQLAQEKRSFGMYIAFLVTSVLSNNEHVKLNHH
jgi:hypothetical protein